jgi:hypothetical protein
MRARVAADSATPAASILARCLSLMLKVLISVFPPYLQAFWVKALFTLSSCPINRDRPAELVRHARTRAHLG